MKHKGKEGEERHIAMFCCALSLFSSSSSSSSSFFLSFPVHKYQKAAVAGHEHEVRSFDARPKVPRRLNSGVDLSAGPTTKKHNTEKEEKV